MKSVKVPEAQGGEIVVEPSKTDRVKPRIGVAKGQIEVPDSFFEPLPDEILRAFSGESPIFPTSK